jgi:hypothetical protein
MSISKINSDLILKYQQEIEEIILDSEHTYRLTIDYEILDLKILELLDNCKIDGIDEKTIWNLIQARIPSYINYKNSKSTHFKKAS